MAWILLTIAGLLEVGMALSLGYSHGFTRPLPSVLVLAFGAMSFGLLSVALKSLPIGTGYAVWTGIGAAGTAVAGMLLLGESAGPLRIACIALIVIAVIGLQSAGGHA